MLGFWFLFHFFFFLNFKRSSSNKTSCYRSRFAYFIDFIILKKLFYFTYKNIDKNTRLKVNFLIHICRIFYTKTFFFFLLTLVTIKIEADKYTMYLHMHKHTYFVIAGSNKLQHFLSECKRTVIIIQLLSLNAKILISICLHKSKVKIN